MGQNDCDTKEKQPTMQGGPASMLFAGRQRLRQGDGICPYSRSETALATTVHYISLAGALVHHNRKITPHSHETLDKSFRLLTRRIGWPPN